MLKICLAFWESEPQYAYKRYACKRKNMYSKNQFWSRKSRKIFDIRQDIPGVLPYVPQCLTKKIN